MTVVVFSYTDWATRYPEFTRAVTKPVAQGYFDEACLYLSNLDDSVVGADPVNFQPRKSLLNMLTAHIAALYTGIGSNAPSPFVGRVSEASEGSVSVKAELGDLPASAVWFAQTKYGLAYWQATARYRTARWIAGPRPYLGVRRSAWGRY